jgi:hypothetical protein
MRKVIIISFIIILIFNLTIYGEENRRQDPFLAGALSWYMAGLGQIYAGKYLKGTIFWIVDYSLYISTILSVADINFSSNKDIGFQLNIKPKENLTQKEKTIAISLGISYVLFHIYNVVDAVRIVHYNNLKISENNFKNSFSVSYKSEENNNYLLFNYRF